jgi:hypothetical protein|tara:strand:- start:330 stop:596 length:267 start_codon:yes stop_codon:yes gene_type:complete
MRKMINFIKNLFKPKFVPQDEIQEYLITLGFKQSSSNKSLLIKNNNTHNIVYNMEESSVKIVKDGGEIVLKSFGNISKIKRFITKYSI